MVLARHPSTPAQAMRTSRGFPPLPPASSTLSASGTLGGSTQTSKWFLVFHLSWNIHLLFFFLSVIARAQVNRFSDGKWKKASTYEDATAIWNEMCELYHNHDNGSPPPSSPTPLPSPSPPHRTSLPPHTLAPRTPSRPTMSRPATARSPPSAVRPTPSSARRVLPVASPLSTPPKRSSEPKRFQPTIPIVESTRHPVPWRPGETLWGIEGIHLLFEDRYVRSSQHLNHLLRDGIC
jgi:hypothetical protein